MYARQEVWGTLIAAYLFLGGVGGATAAIGLTADQFFKPDRRMGVIAALSSLVFLAAGTVLLLADLLQPLNTIYFFMNPGSWIFWGIMFIVGMMGFEVLYVLPYLEDWPLVGLLSRGLAFLKSWQKATALLGALCGFAVTVYTGFLLSAAPGIPFWNTLLLPTLFTVSAFSTGLAYLMVALTLAGGKSGWHEVGGLGRIDAGAIVLEVAVLTAFLGLAWYSGRPEAAYSVITLLGNLGFVIGFLLLGVLAPLALEVYVLIKGHAGAATMARANLYLLSGLLVLAGGYLLRQYVLWAGFYVKTW